MTRNGWQQLRWPGRTAVHCSAGNSWARSGSIDYKMQQAAVNLYLH